MGGSAGRHVEACHDADDHERKSGQKRIPDGVAEDRHEARQQLGRELHARRRLQEILRVGKLVEQCGRNAAA